MWIRGNGRGMKIYKYTNGNRSHVLPHRPRLQQSTIRSRLTVYTAELIVFWFFFLLPFLYILLYASYKRLQRGENIKCKEKKTYTHSVGNIYVYFMLIYMRGGRGRRMAIRIYNHWIAIRGQTHILWRENTYTRINNTLRLRYVRISTPFWRNAN